jgi:hypothetical protein
MRYLTLLSAVVLAAIAAYISVFGLSKIFSGIIIPFAALEACKIVGVLYLHAHWDETKLAMKGYLCTAIGILMILTSTGIYGYLSNAAMSHTNASQTQLSKLEFIDTQIKTGEARRKELVAERTRLDGYVDSVSKDNGSVGVSLHSRQKAQRQSIDAEIKTIDKDTQKLRQDRLSVEGSNRDVQMEVGPAVYLAKTFYGDSSINSIEGAIRIVIYLIVFAFDPLATVLLMASQGLFTKKEKVVEYILNVPQKIEEPILHQSHEELHVDGATHDLPESNVEIKPVVESVPEVPAEVAPLVSTDQIIGDNYRKIIMQKT